MYLSSPVSLIMLILTLTMLTLFEPAFANKFETIGSGVSGSNRIKLDAMGTIALVFGIIMWLCAVLSVTIGQKNALMLSFTMWKESAFIFFIFGALSFLFVLVA